MLIHKTRWKINKKFVNSCTSFFRKNNQKLVYRSHIFILFQKVLLLDLDLREEFPLETKKKISFLFFFEQIAFFGQMELVLAMELQLVSSQ